MARERAALQTKAKEAVAASVRKDGVARACKEKAEVRLRCTSSPCMRVRVALTELGTCRHVGTAGCAEASRVHKGARTLRRRARGSLAPVSGWLPPRLNEWCFDAPTPLSAPRQSLRAELEALRMTTNEDAATQVAAAVESVEAASREATARARSDLARARSVSCCHETDCDLCRCLRLPWDR